MKKIVSLFGISIILFAFVVSMQNSYAASPRTCLIEEGTQWNCGPCASNNPILEKFLSTKDPQQVMCMTYHAWWPGTDDDAMYHDDMTMHKGRINYYAIQGVPTAEANGVCWAMTDQSWNGRPGDTAGLINEMNKTFGKSCPYTITINQTKSGNTVNIEVIVATDIALSGKKLRVGAVEYHHNYPTAGTNGEHDFYNVTRKMLPDFNGQDCSIPAGQSKTFTFSYTVKSTWNKDLMYCIAFIQDDGSKQVLQAASNLKLLKAEASVQTSPFMKIDVNQQQSKSITIKNSNAKSVTYDLAVDKTNFPAGWDATLAKTKVTIPAGGTEDVDVTVNVPDAAGFVAVPVAVTPESTTEVTITATAYVYALSSKTKYAAFYGTSATAPNDFQPLVQHTTYGPLAAYIPFAEAVLDAYPFVQTFDAVFLSFDINVYGILGGFDAGYGALPDKLFNNLTGMISAGKKVYITSDMDMGIAYDAFASSNITGSQNAKDFFSKTLGLNYASTAVRYHTQNGYIYPDQFTANGIASDPISKDWVSSALTLNQYNSQTHPYYMQFSDIFTPNLTKGANPIFYYDGTISSVGGARITKGDARIVYMSFPPTQITSTTTAKTLTTKILDWLLGGGEVGAPEISLSVSSLNFDSVEVGKSKDLPFVISNTGNKPLKVSNITVAWDDPPGTSSFSVLNPPSFPKTINPGATTTITVRFAPKEEGKPNDLIEISSDDPNASTTTVSVDGIGIIATSVKDGIYSVGDFSMNAGPNPFSEKTIVKYSLNGDIPQELSMTVVDASGREVAKLVNGTIAPGSYNLEFNGSAFAAGTYYIIANINGKSEQLPIVLVK
jgi:hypothetical protein